MNQSVLKWYGVVLISLPFSFCPLNAQINPTPTAFMATQLGTDPIEFLKESKCMFREKGYSIYSVGYIVRNYVSVGRIKNLSWAKTPIGTPPKSWVVTLSYFDTQEGKNRKVRWNFEAGQKAVIWGDSENDFLSCVPGEKYTHWPGANQMDIIE